MRWVAYRQVKLAVSEYEALEDDVKADVTFEQWMAAEDKNVKEYARNKKQYEGIGIDLDAWLDADDRDREKHKKMIERKARLEQQLKNKAS